MGIDMAVTADRLIVLDCQPLLSNSVILDLPTEGSGPQSRSQSCRMRCVSNRLWSMLPKKKDETFYLELMESNLSIHPCPIIMIIRLMLTRPSENTFFRRFLLGFL